MIDFSATALAAGMDAFARPITITPLKSQDAPHTPYAARGVWSSRDVDIALEGEGILSGQKNTLGIRLAEFAVPPGQGDIIAIPTVGATPDAGTHMVEDSDEDGQGGAILTLKEYEA